jgi:flagellar hook-basal body complex protein FliE
MSLNVAAGAYAQIGRLGAGAAGPRPTVASPAGDFGRELAQAMDASVTLARGADRASAEALAGKGGIVEMVTAVAEAESALETIVALRDRMMAAYDEILRMQV